MPKSILLVPRRPPENVSFDSFEEHAANIGRIDHIRLGEDGWMYANDVGLLQRLPVNAVASFVWQHYYGGDRLIFGTATIIGTGSKNIPKKLARLVSRIASDSQVDDCNRLALLGLIGIPNVILAE